MTDTSISTDQNITPRPLVSIMMTAYNRAELTVEAIESVRQQSYRNWELLVLDDCSTDHTETEVRKLAEKDSRIIYSRAENNLGITKNRNRGFLLARGQYIAVLDCDDLWINPEKLSRQVEFLDTHVDHLMVGTGVIVIDQQGKQTGVLNYALNDAEIRSKMLFRNQFTHSAVLMRRSKLPEPMPYDETGWVSIWEDYELFLRLGNIGKFANLPEIMTAYRWHGGNISKEQRRNGAKAHLLIIRKYRSIYPHYFLAYIKGLIRFLI